MRDLQRNTVNIWYVNVDEITEVMDGDLYTGESTKSFTAPISATISMYPVNSIILKELFGEDVSVDMVASSTNLVFEKDTLIFITEPVSDYSQTYDYSISAISKSLNVNTYGLKSRV